MSEALRLVPKHGWTRLALEEAAANLNLPRTAHGLFRGEIDLVAFFVNKCNDELGAAAAAQAIDEHETMREALKRTTRARLGLVLPLESTWAQGLGVLALPYNVPTALHLLHETADEILHVCGDTATDFSWYTKRGLLSTLYATTELYMLTDMSAGKEDTWRFLDNRLDNYVDSLQKVSQVTKLF